MQKIICLALLRGINVGGNNIIKMNKLKKLFEELNFADVKTYIQSGNVIFTVPENESKNDKIKTAGKIEQKLVEELNSEVKVAIYTFSEMEKIINKRPVKYGGDDAHYRYNVLFFVEPVTAKQAVTEIEAREGVDEIQEANNVLYYTTLKEKITKTYLTKIIGTPVYKNITVRNWNTTKKLYELMKES